MKFNEEQIKGLLHKEQSKWNQDDLSWFDKDFIAQFESNSLNQEDQQKVIAMLANDQMVMDHYLTLKKEKSAGTSPVQSKAFSFNPKFAFAPMALASLMLVFWLVNIEPKPQAPDVYRSPTEVLIYPHDKKTLHEVPTYLVAPFSDERFVIKLHNHQGLIWESPELITPRVYLPPEIRSQITEGLYHWQAITVDQTTKHNYQFTISR